MGYIRKALEKGYLEHPKSACCTDDMPEIFVCFGRCLCGFLPVFSQQAATISAYKFTPCAVASPNAPQKPLVRKRARSGGANWVQVTREKSPSKAKRPWTGGSHQPACTHKEHQILTTAEAASFASQFWDCKVHPTKASKQVLLATRIDVDLEKMGSLPLWEGATMRMIRIQNNQWCLKHCLVLCIVQFAASAQKCDHLPPPPPGPIHF